MLLVLVLILILIGAAVVGSIYSNFLVFYSNFSESENYHKAYYNSIAALERAELVTRLRGPGYEGSGGWILGTSQGTYTNGGSDKKITSNFSYLSDTEFVDKSSIFRKIKSRTTRIPDTGNGDVEFMLAYKAPEGGDTTENSSNYNMMDYKDSEIFLMYYDDNNNKNPYTKIDCQNGECTDSKPTEIFGKIRLPKYIKEGFIGTNNDLTTTDVELDTKHPLIQNASLPKDDAIVDRQIRGNYNKTEGSFPFSIFASQSYYEEYSEIKIRKRLDSAIRESHINNDLNFKFSNTKWSPISGSDNGLESELIIISPQEKDILNNLEQTPIKRFQDLFLKDEYTNKQLRFSLLNLLQAQLSGMIYPFLEYYVDFGTTVSDKYFTINAEGNYDDYKINTIIRKPTIKESILGNFTTIF